MEQRTSLFSDSFVKYSLVGVLAILALFLFAKIWVIADDLSRPRFDRPTITVSGTGKVSTPPTIAEISFMVDERATTQAAAQESATKKVDAALAALTGAGVEEKDIQTQNYQVMPQYDRTECKPGVPCPPNNTIVSYQVTQSVSVKVRETAKTGAILEALSLAGVQNVSGPNFRLDDATEAQAQARGKAIADAHEKAKVLAEQLGVDIGRVVGFSEGWGGVPVYEGLGKGGMDAGIRSAVAPSIPQGETETSITVNISYEIR